MRLWKCKVLLFLLVATPLTLSASGAMQYANHWHQSQWQHEQQRLMCTLSQEIPQFGRAVFKKPAGEPLTMYLYSNQHVTGSGNARVVLRPAPWQHGQSARVVAKIRYHGGEHPIHLEQKPALRVLAGLESGQFPVFSVHHWGDRRQHMEIALSAVRFQEGMAAFRECQAQLFPYSFKQIRDTDVRFRPGRIVLTDEHKAHLRHIIEYLQLDPKVSEIRIHGFADDGGNRQINQSLSEHRASAVYDYLLKHKVPEEKLIVRFYGDRQPLGVAAEARAKRGHRRVDIQLVRDD